MQTTNSIVNVRYDSLDMKLLLQQLDQKHRFPKDFKREQSVAIHSVLSGKDVLALLPTGFGKSLIYTIPGVLITQIHKISSYTLIVSPLTSLITDSIQNLKTYGLRGIHVAGDFDLVDEFMSNTTDYESVYLFTSPEVIQLKRMKDMIVALRPVLIAVDEGHLVSEWGKSFRKEYSNLHELRCLVDCPVAVLTATLTRDLELEVIRKVGLRKGNLTTISLSPDRPNIFLDRRVRIQKTKRSGKTMKFEELNFLIADLRRGPISTSKTLIFVTSMNTMADIFIWFQEHLGDSLAQYDGDHFLGYCVEMFSSTTESQAKQNILQEFVKLDSRIRILICTVAYGLGVDNRNIRRVVMYGLPSSRLLLLQEIGRAGRDGLPGEAIIFPFKTPNIMDEDYQIPLDKCIRSYLLQPFERFGIKMRGYSDRKPPSPEPDDFQKWTCCSFCRSTCAKCDTCSSRIDMCEKCDCCGGCKNRCEKSCEPGVCWP